MPTLAFDTATDVLSLALGEGERVLAEIDIDAGRSHLERLLPAARELLGRAGMSIDDMTSIVVGTGPGTFSGLRVGIATARALAQSLEIPLFGSSTLEALAKELAAGIDGSAHGWILPLIDARRSQVFTQLYRKEGEKGLRAESEVLCLDPEQIEEMLPEDASGEIRAGGNGALAYREIFLASQRLSLLQADDQANRIRAARHLGSQETATGFSPGQLLAVLPSYVREPDADKTVLQKKRAPWLK